MRFCLFSAFHVLFEFSVVEKETALKKKRGGGRESPKKYLWLSRVKCLALSTVRRRKTSRVPCVGHVSVNGSCWTSYCLIEADVLVHQQ